MEELKVESYKLQYKTFVTIGTLIIVDGTFLNAAGLPSVVSLFLYPLLELIFKQDLVYTILVLYKMSWIIFFAHAAVIKRKITRIEKELVTRQPISRDEVREIHNIIQNNPDPRPKIKLLKFNSKELYKSLFIVIVSAIIAGIFFFGFFDSFFIKRSVQAGYNALAVGNCEAASEYGFSLELCLEDPELLESITNIEVIRIEQINDEYGVQIIIHFINENGVSKKLPSSRKMKKESFFKWVFVSDKNQK